MADPDDLEEEDEDAWRHIPVPSELTPEIFARYRAARRGNGNPERMNNPLWEWLISSRWSAYHIEEFFHPEHPWPTEPGWCFQRFGQTTTLLPDGRRVLIGGEHEDSYDPDFFIYNDVVIQEPSGATQILGYSVEAFPPTDFHTATLVGDQIIVIGCLGYLEQRRSGFTPVLSLDTKTFAFSPIETSGNPPGWICEHRATLIDDATAILITGGTESGRQDVSPVENIDQWKLDLRTWTWTRLTDRRWERWELRRADGVRHHLFEIGSARFSKDRNWTTELEQALQQLADECGRAPDLDLVPHLYRPRVSHELVPPEENAHRTARIQIHGVTVRYVQGMYGIQMTVEGELPAATIDVLKADLLGKLEALENASCAWIRL